ncbi:hypothetical protein AALP_AA5G123700 [Arabis alpina]|uniref:Uncharacterized protein n=1 Tax=Arabis alpina TaxID=50452 RepID=A0A087GWM3_ARAAL|nr:hypothetical protein AALP_AA5G123700 [Arabis alpina]
MLSQQERKEVPIVHLLFSIVQKKQIKHFKTLMETKRWIHWVCHIN